MDLAKAELIAVEAAAVKQKADAIAQLDELGLAYAENFGGLGDVVGF